MKKTITLLLLFSSLLWAKNAIIDDVFMEGKSNIEKKIKSEIKDKYGWNKKVVEGRLKDGTYTETQIKKTKKDVSEKVIRADVKEKHDRIKPVSIEVVKIELQKIITAEIPVFTPQNLSFLCADWGTVKSVISKLSPEQREVLRFKIARVETVKTILKSIDKKNIETAVLFVVDLTKQGNAQRFDDVKLKALLKAHNYAGVKELLSQYDIPEGISDAVISGIIPQKEPFFVDAVFGENAYLLDSDYNREVENGDVVIVNVSDLIDRLKFAEFVSRNRGKRYVVQLGLGAMNNKDSPGGEWQDIARQFKEFYILAKSCDPELTVGVTVCAAPNWKKWLDSFEFNPDVVFIWNIYKTGFSVRAVKKQFGENIIIAGMNAMVDSKETSSPGELIKKVKDAGFKGVIWYNRHP